MPDFMMTWFGSEGFMPHGHCFLWTPSLLWTFVLADALIGLSYYSIPVGLLYFVGKRKDLRFNWIFKLFSVFIFACGTTHLLAIWTIWHPDYWLDAGVKALTAVASLITAVMLWPLIPQAIKLPSTRQLEEIVAQLKLEIKQREVSEAEQARLKNISENRFHHLFDQVALGIVEVDSSSRRILRANKQFCAIMGYAQEELLQPDFSYTALVGGIRDDQANLASADGRTHEHNKETRCRRKDGNTIWVNINASPLGKTDEPSSSYIVIVEDISARKLSAEALARQYAELQRWQQATLGRETRMQELKREVNQLLVRAGEAPRYASVAADPADG